jgi:hypothetical protein
MLSSSPRFSLQLLFSSIAHWLGAPPTLSPSASPAAGPPFDPHPYVLSLLPLLLAGVTDPSPEVATRSLELVEHVGRQLAEPPDTGNAMAVDQAADCRTGGPENGHSGPSEQSARGGWRGPPLPPPYKGRPGSGIQRVVGMHLAELLRPLQRELREWTVASRQRAARVLHTVLVMGGETITSHVDVIVPMLCAAVGDEDPDMAQLVVSCGHVVGAVVAPQAWVPLMGDELTAARATSAQKANRLVILAALLHASQQGGLSVEHVALVRFGTALGSLQEWQELSSPIVDKEVCRGRWVSANCVLLSKLRKEFVRLVAFNNRSGCQ